MKKANSKKSRIGLGAQIVAAVLLPLGGACGQQSLERVEKAVEKAYAAEHLPAETLHRALAGSDSAAYLLFDVRQPGEYAVSRIGPALQVDPEASADDFIAAHGAALAGRRVVFYCSVGYRSSKLLKRVERAAVGAGAVSLANLRGGIFRWHNEGLPLEADGDTARVHPYDRHWGRLLNK